MGHVPILTIHKMSTRNCLSDFKLLLPETYVHPCEGCMMDKHHKSSNPTNPNKQRSSTVGQLIHGDVLGRLHQTPSLYGSYYYILYKDDVTTCTFVHFSKQKSEALPFFTRVIKFVKQDTSHNIYALQTNQGREFCNTLVNQFLDNPCILRQTSTVYTPQ